jgi:uncharacterized protein
MAPFERQDQHSSICGELAWRSRMRTLLLWMIRVYRSRISPYKGFHCAYRVRTNARSCSAFGFDAIRRHGALVGLLLLRRRLKKCGNASRLEVGRPKAISLAAQSQSGHCDLPLGDCNSGHGCDVSDVVDYVPCDDCGCTDAWSRLRQKWTRRVPTR